MVYFSQSEDYKSKAKEKIAETHPVGIEYLVRNERLKQDHTNKIDKMVEKVRLKWGFFGYTYLGEGKMWINESLDYTPELKREVEVHEAIHTNDEYETRLISRDMVKREQREDILKRILRN